MPKPIKLQKIIEQLERMKSEITYAADMADEDGDHKTWANWQDVFTTIDDAQNTLFIDQDDWNMD